MFILLKTWVHLQSFSMTLPSSVLFTSNKTRAMYCHSIRFWINLFLILTYGTFAFLGVHTHFCLLCQNHESMPESTPAPMPARPKLYILLSQYRGRGTCGPKSLILDNIFWQAKKKILPDLCPNSTWILPVHVFARISPALVTFSAIATLVGGGQEKPPLRDKIHH